MASFIAINYFILFLGVSILVSVTKADFQVLKTSVLSENNEIIELEWRKAESYLADKNLPIWTTYSTAPNLARNENILKELGKFIMYHDLEKSSAIVFLEDWNCIYGTIDVRYHIMCLPLTELNTQHKIGQSEYVKKLKDGDYSTCNNPVDLSAASTSRGHSPHKFNRGLKKFQALIKTWVKSDVSPIIVHDSSGSEDEKFIKSLPSTSHSDPPPSKRQRVALNYKEQIISVYPEILIVISNELTRRADKLSSIVLQYLVQFNTVSMLFAKLASRNIKIYINIAGIVIEDKPLGLPTTSVFQQGNPNSKFLITTITDYLNSVRNDQHPYQTTFSDDSFDFFAFFTAHKWQGCEAHFNGISTEVYDIMDARKSHQLFRRRLGSMVNVANPQYFITVAREIAHLMTVKDNSLINLCANDEACHSIMQPCLNCPNSLTWSKENIKDFKIYLSVNDNRCYLRNLPRSLFAYGLPVPSLFPADQCLCFGYNPPEQATYVTSSNKYRTCSRKIFCDIPKEIPRLRGHLTPIDGTPCNAEGTMVCWRQKCVWSFVLTTNY